jgi:hypothetical protein
MIAKSNHRWIEFVEFWNMFTVVTFTELETDTDDKWPTQPSPACQAMASVLLNQSNFDSTRHSARFIHF